MLLEEAMASGATEAPAFDVAELDAASRAEPVKKQDTPRKGLWDSLGLLGGLAHNFSCLT